MVSPDLEATFFGWPICKNKQNFKNPEKCNQMTLEAFSHTEEIQKIPLQIKMNHQTTSENIHLPSWYYKDLLALASKRGWV